MAFFLSGQSLAPAALTMVPPRVHHAPMPTSLSSVFTQVLILFLLLVTGFGARKLRVFSAEATKGMTSLILKVSLPAMVLHSMVVQPFSPALLQESLHMLAVSFGVYGVLLALCIPLGRIIGGPGRDRGVYRFIMVFSNVGFMGFPVVKAVFGDEALFHASIYNLPFNLLAFTVGIVLLVRTGHSAPDSGTVGASASSRSPEFRLEWHHVLSPVVVAILAGYGLFLAGAGLPGPLLSFTAILGDLTTPLSMLVVGSLLAQSSLRNAVSNPRLWLVSALRLLVWPLAVWSILRLLVSDPLLAAIPALITGMPAAANAALLASEYDSNEALASQGVFLSTLLSVATIPLVVLIIRAVP